MRNQKRKLLPDLFYSFRQLLDLCEDKYPSIGDKLYLYLHTSYPDAGWDIPNLIKDHRISNKVLFTYFCKNCNNISSKRFCGTQTVCKRCGEQACSFPSVISGVSSEQLSYIYNAFDMYVQYAICEGAGMPQIEASACGLPVFTVSYSAMVDIINKLDATGIKVKHKFKELETKAMRAYPDSEHLVKELIKWINTSEDAKNKKKEQIRKLTEKHYNWDNTAQKWEEYLDKLDSSGYRSDWNKPLQLLQNIPDQITEEQVNNQYFDLMMYIANNNLEDYNKISSMLFLDMLKDLDYGFTQNGLQIANYNLSDALEVIRTYINNQNNSEKARESNIQFNDDFIQYAHMKGSI